MTCLRSPSAVPMLVRIFSGRRLGDTLRWLFFLSDEPVRGKGFGFSLHGDGFEPLEREGAFALEVGALTNEYLTRLGNAAEAGGNIDGIPASP